MDILGINKAIDKAIRDINPPPFDIWQDLFDAIDRDREMQDFMLWTHWALYALGGMSRVNLEEVRKLAIDLGVEV